MALPGLQERSVACAGIKSWGRASSYNPLIIPINFQGSQLPSGIQLCLPDSLSSPGAQQSKSCLTLIPLLVLSPQSPNFGPSSWGLWHSAASLAHWC